MIISGFGDIPQKFPGISSWFGISEVCKQNLSEKHFEINPKVHTEWLDYQEGQLIKVRQAIETIPLFQHIPKNQALSILWDKISKQGILGRLLNQAAQTMLC